MAWRCCVAWKITATELVKPTSTETNPATSAEKEKSFSMDARTPPAKQIPRAAATAIAGNIFGQRYGSWIPNCHGYNIIP
ncbi:hypothetical protein llg_14410 [Luteolibacter sp. LG18]|nr:hypothetical protein llg_14410 [Luteolibacter sp. LG18]